MSEVLSQSQIDALLRSVASGAQSVDSVAAPAAKVARKYDFLAPKKFTKDSLRVVDSIYSNYVRVIQTTLSSFLRLSCDVELLEIEEQKYNEFNNALNDNDVLSVLSFKVDEDNYYDEPILIQISNPIISVMIDRMLGGTGMPSEDDFSGYTDIELNIYENITGYIVPLMNDVWRNFFTVDITFDRMEENPRLMQDIAIDDTVVIVVLNITVLDVSGQMNICLPGNSLEAIFTTLEDKRRVPGNRTRDSRRQPDAASMIFSTISGSALELTVKLGDTEVNLGDVFHMRVGDIIRLSNPKDSDAILCVEGIPWFKGQLGVQRNNKALKIKESVKEQQE